MRETKKMQIMPQDEERIINAYACFGWVVTSSQEVKVKDSHLEAGAMSGTIYSVTETENYVNLLLQRETDMPNYQALNACQKAYESAQSRLKAKKKFKALLLLLGNILYVIYYIIANKKISESNDVAFAEMDKALNKARQIQAAK